MNIIVIEPIYWLATDRVKVAHFGYAEVGMQVTTGQPELLTYTTMEQLIDALVSLNFPVMDGSTHQQKEWYVWVSKGTADAALATINNNKAFPVSIFDLASRERTVTVASWCSTTTALADGRWGFPRIPSDLLNEWNISMEDRTDWLAVFKPTIVIDPTI